MSLACVGSVCGKKRQTGCPTTFECSWIHGLWKCRDFVTCSSIIYIYSQIAIPTLLRLLAHHGVNRPFVHLYHMSFGKLPGIKTRTPKNVEQINAVSRQAPKLILYIVVLFGAWEKAGMPKMGLQCLTYPRELMSLFALNGWGGWFRCFLCQGSAGRYALHGFLGYERVGRPSMESWKTSVSFLR